MATKITEASLTCSICLRRFRKPRALPCLHSYCEECLIEYAPSGTQVMMCPLCQEKVSIPDGDVSKLKLDFRLKSQVEEADRYDKESGILNEEIVCNCCEDESPALAKCEQCDQLLCTFGVKAHKNITTLRGHDVVLIDTEGFPPVGQLEKRIDVQAGDHSSDDDPIEKRAILVSNIPDIKHSPERVRDRITIHFQRKRHGGGDVDGVLYPVKGCPQNAVVVFNDKETCVSVLKCVQFLEDFQMNVTVEPLPQIFKEAEAEVSAFYWNLVPRLTTTKLIDDLSKKFGKTNLQVIKHILAKVKCPISQLEAVHSAIVKAVGLGTTSSGHDAIDKGIIITNIPYLTDEIQQLREELTKHVQSEGVDQLQSLICPIQGNTKEAIVVFQTVKGCEEYMKRSDTSFYGDTLYVTKLPPVFECIHARLEDFFVNLLKHIGASTLVSKLKSCGDGITFADNEFTGSPEQLMEAADAIRDVTGLTEANLFSKPFCSEDSCKKALDSHEITDATQTTLDCTRVKLERTIKAVKTKKRNDILYVQEGKDQITCCGTESSIINDGIRDFQISAGMSEEGQNASSNNRLVIKAQEHSYVSFQCSDSEAGRKLTQGVVRSAPELPSSDADAGHDFPIVPTSADPMSEEIPRDNTNNANLIAKDSINVMEEQAVNTSVEDSDQSILTIKSISNNGDKSVNATYGATSQQTHGDSKSNIRRTGDEVHVTKTSSENRQCSKSGTVDMLATIIPGMNLNESKAIIQIHATQTYATHKNKNGDGGSTLVKEGEDWTGPHYTFFKATNANKDKGSPSGNLPPVFNSKEGLHIIVLQDDITKQSVDIIVNAANGRLNHNAGVAGAISRAARRQLQSDCDKIMWGRKALKIGQCIETKGYKLPCKHVIHAIGPAFQGQKNLGAFFRELTNTCMNIFQLAESKNAQSLAIPLISSGNFGGPKDVCASALATALFNFSSLGARTSIQQIFLVNIDQEATITLQSTLSDLFPMSDDRETSNMKTQSDSGLNATNAATFNTNEGIEVLVVTGDITKGSFNAIVNAANGELLHGGGVDAAIARAAGKRIQDESKRIITQRKAPLKVGECEVTDGYSLGCKVVHAVGPVYNKCRSDEEFYNLLEKTFFNAIRCANIPIEAKEVAIPLISSGIYGGPIHICAAALARAVTHFSKVEKNLAIRRIWLVNIDEEATKVVREAFGDIFKPQPSVAGFAGCIKTKSGIQIQGLCGDISQQNVEAIVNPTTPTLQHNEGIAGYISDAAGYKLQQRCNFIFKTERNKMLLGIGETVVTENFDLPCKHIIHTFAPTFTPSSPTSFYGLLLKTYLSCLQCANSFLKVRTVSFPLLSSGSIGGPNETSAKALADAMTEFERSTKTSSLVKINIVCKDEDALVAVKKTMSVYFSSEKVTDTSESPGSYAGAITASGARQSAKGQRGQISSSVILTSSGKLPKSNQTCQLCKKQSGESHTLEGCKHIFCNTCVRDKVAPQSRCLECESLYGLVSETNLGGQMKYYQKTEWRLEGVSQRGAIVMDFKIKSGTQNTAHPSPGDQFKGMAVQAYLPGTQEGCEVLFLLRLAFLSGRMFKVSCPVLYGDDYRVELDGIPLKTQTRGGKKKHGYPDLDYLPTVKKILKDKGVTFAATDIASRNTGEEVPRSKTKDVGTKVSKSIVK